MRISNGGTTIKEVAQVAGVSISTVSLVLNGKPGVSGKVRARVLDIAKELAYVPNEIARSLVMKETRSVGVVIPDISEMYFGILARAIQERLDEQHYSVILCNSENERAKESEALKLFVAKGVDAIIMVPCIKSMMEQLQYLKLPLVFVDQYVEGMEASYVGIDFLRAGYEATAHLIRLHHRRIGCITGIRGATGSELRMVGYRKALAEAGIPFDPAIIRECDLNVQGGYRAARELITLKVQIPTAIFVMGDTCAIGVYKALDEAGLSIPESVAIVGFDDMPFAPYLKVPLTTVSQPIRDIGFIAVDLLFDQIRTKDKQEKRKVILSAELIIRESCGWRRAYSTRFQN